MKTFHYPHPFKLECGEILPDITIAYHTYGKINGDGSNVVWVCHALTANSDVREWWPNTVAEGRFLDPNRFFIVCANILGSCYGTTGPLSVNPLTDKPWYGTFPHISVRDVVTAHQLLAAHLGIKKIHTLIGSSVGGFQCVEWCVTDPAFIEKAVIIASDSRCTPWVAAFNESQRMAIENDHTFGEETDRAGLRGMATARSIALLSYRGGKAYNATQDECQSALFERQSASYQRYQGEKLAKRFNAYSYYRISQIVDSHDIGRGRGGDENALQKITAKTLVIAISSDILFPTERHERMVNHIPHADYHVIDSIYGHDGFLVESDQLNDIIMNFYQKTKNQSNE